MNEYPQASDVVQLGATFAANEDYRAALQCYVHALGMQCVCVFVCALRPNCGSSIVLWVSDCSDTGKEGWPSN